MRMIKFLLDVPFTAEEVARAVVRLKGRSLVYTPPFLAVECEEK